MTFTHTTTRRAIERGSLLLVGAALLGAPAGADPSEHELIESLALPASASPEPTALGGLREALMGGQFWASFRYRFENVDQQGIDKEAHASTLRSRLGYKSAEWKGFTGVLEFSNVANIGASQRDYESEPPAVGDPPPSRPVVADPVGSQVNQSYLAYSNPVGEFRFGRQRITYDKARFIGNVGWRQTEQNYDAISYDKEFNSGLRARYAYLANVNTIFQANQKLDGHLLHLGQTWNNIGQLSAYGYYLDYDAVANLSSFTIGARFTGERNSGDWSLLYGIEYAHQSDTADNSNDLDASYSHAYLGGKVHGAHVKVGFEVLEGNGSGDPLRAFQTPLATKHAFNGWADQFLTTPGDGLEDTYFDIGFAGGDFKGGLVYHIFAPEQSGTVDYGDELDLYAKYEIAEDLEFGAKYADFRADTGGGFDDVTKFWIWLAYSF